MSLRGPMLASAALLATSWGVAQNAEAVKQGELVFNRTCATGYCHGIKGVGAGAPRLAARGFDQAYLESTVTRGLKDTSMPAFAGTLSRPDLNAVIAYVASLNGLVYSPPAAAEGGGAVEPKAVLSAEAKRGQDLFSDALRGFGRCSTCHEVNAIGIPVAAPIASVPADVEALRKLATPSVRTARFDSQTVPALLISNGSRGTMFYDLTVAPPVLHTAQPGTVAWSDGTDWRHSSVLGSYSDDELEAILAYLRSAAQL